MQHPDSAFFVELVRRPRVGSRLLTWTLLALTVLSASPLIADRLPSAPSGHLAISSQVDLSGAQRKAAETCLASSNLDVQYLAAIIDTTDVPGDRSTRRGDAVPFAEALYQSWARSGRIDRGEGNAMVLVVALGDRAVAARPGGLWVDAGFESAVITRTIDGSEFARFARIDRPGDALCALRDAIEAELGRRLGIPTAKAAPPVTAQNAAPRAAASEPAGEPEAGASQTKTTKAQEEGPKPPETTAEKIGYACGTVIGWGIVGLFLAALVGVPALIAWWLFRKLRHYLTRDRRRAEDEVQTWRTKLRAAADRLLALEQQHPLYFAVDSRRYDGETAELDRRAADAVNRSFLLYSRAEELVGHADTMLQTGDAEEAWKLLRESEIAWDKGVPEDADDRRRIFVPLETEYRGLATELLDDLQAAYADAVDALDEIAAVEAASRERVERADEMATEALAGAVRRAELGLPADALHDALEAAIERRRALETRSATDPIGAADDLEACIAELVELRDRAEMGNAVLDELAGPITELGKSLRNRLDGIRSEGRTVEEPGFDPDLRLDRGSQQAERVEAMLAAGDDAEALAELERLRHGLEELAGQLQVLQDAPTKLKPALAQLDARVDTLRGRIPEAQGHLDRLSRQHAEASYADEAEALDGLDALLSELTSWRLGVDQEIAADHWLAASEDLATGERLVASAEALLDAVAARRQELEAARTAAQERIGRLERQLGAMRTLVTMPGVTEVDRRRLDELATSAGELFVAARQTRPHWAELKPRLDADLLEAERLANSMTADRDAESAAEQRAATLDSELGALRQRVLGEHRDRPRVERTVDDAIEQLAAWRDMSAAEIGGRGRLERLDDVADRLEAAEHAFRSEMDIVREAEQAIAAAESEIRQEDGRGHGHGVIAHCAEARRRLDDARRAAADRRWEEVESIARAARQAARDEGRRARDEARRREDEERRRLERIQAREAAHRRRMAMEAVVTTARVASAVLGSSKSSIGRRGPIFRTPRKTSRPKKFHGGGGGRGGGSGWSSPGGGSRW